MREAELEDILVKEIRNAGGRAYKWISPGNSGVPDRIVFLPNGKIIFVELKTDSGIVSGLQKIQIKRLQDLGQDVRIVKGIGGLVDFFDFFGLDEAAMKLWMRYADEIHTT